MDLTPTTNVDLSKIFLSNAAGNKDMSVAGATVHNAYNERMITMTLTEEVRANALRISDTAGGDGVPLVLDIEEGGIMDVSHNLISAANGVTVLQFDDIRPPIIEIAGVDLDTGILTLHVNETVDVTPASYIDVTQYFLMDEPSQFGTAVRIPLSQLVTFTDGVSFNISLESFEIANAIAISGTPGGDGKAMVLDITTGALRDIAGNLIQPATNITVVERPDITPPVPFNATIFYETGIVLIEANEPLDLTPTTYVNLENIQIGAVSDTCDSANYPEICTLLGATVAIVNDSFTATIQLTEKQRVAAIADS